jgi:hypothetical protein
MYICMYRCTCCLPCLADDGMQLRNGNRPPVKSASEGGGGEEKSNPSRAPRPLEVSDVIDRGGTTRSRSDQISNRLSSDITTVPVCLSVCADAPLSRPRVWCWKEKKRKGVVTSRTTTAHAIHPCLPCLEFRVGLGGGWGVGNGGGWARLLSLVFPPPPDSEPV